MADDNARELCRRETKAFEGKDNLHALWQEIALNFRPQRADFTSTRTVGEEFAINLFDSEPIRCCRDLADARASMLRPKGMEWYKAALADDKKNDLPDVARFLDGMNQRSRSLIYSPDTGFVRAEKEADHDIAPFGNSVKTVEPDIDVYGERYMLVRTWHLRDCAWFDNKAGTRQDVVFRRFKLAARHIPRMFPKAPLHDAIKEALKKDPDKEFQLCHTMMPAEEYEYNKKPRRADRNMPWVSVYYDSEHKMLLRERPSHRFRYVIDRWETIPGSQYGYSPAAMTSLPDARGIQMMALVLLEAGEKEIDPPLKATRGPVLGEIHSEATGITWVDAEYDEKLGPAIERLYPAGRNLPFGIELIERSTRALRDNWYISKLSLPQQAKTAYETAQLVEQFIRSNIPLFEPWEAGVAMMLDEVFHVLIEMGEFGDPREWPKAMQGNEIIFNFKNPLQDAIERNKANYATAALGLIAGAAQVNPSAPGARRVDIDEMIADSVRGLGAPADWLIDEEEAQATAQQEAQKAQIVQALQGAGAAADIAKTGTEAAANLQQMAQPADGSSVYGPS